MSAATLNTAQVATTMNAVTWRQLDHWKRVGAITPTRRSYRSGCGDEWAERDIARLRVIDGFVEVITLTLEAS